jgi:hypothetical protein
MVQVQGQQDMFGFVEFAGAGRRLDPAFCAFS